MGVKLPGVASTEQGLLTAQLAEKKADKVLARSAGQSLAAYLELTKPRILVLILLTSIAGFCLASQGVINTKLLAHMSVGVGLLAAGIAALNQFFERDVDRVMRRTERRPLPSGRISAARACAFGILTAILGTAYLFLFINPLAGCLALFTLG